MRPPVPSGTVYIKDPVDVWGKEQTIGLAEHAARLGSPATFDRRGTVFVYDDFENAPLKWNVAGGAGCSATLSDEHPASGSGCMKMVPASVADSYVRAYKLIGGVSQHKLGAEITIYRDDEVAHLVGLVIRAYTGSRVITSGVSLQMKGFGGLSYLHGSDPSLTANWTTFNDTFEIFEDATYPLKFVVDVDSEKYVRCMFGGTEIDMSAYAPHAAASTYAQLVTCDIYIPTPFASNAKTYFDNFILTIQEPDND